MKSNQLFVTQLGLYSFAVKSLTTLEALRMGRGEENGQTVRHLNPVLLQTSNRLMK